METLLSTGNETGRLTDMKARKIYQVDAFTQQLFGGNPAGVVTAAEGLTEKEMELIAREMNCSETAFILPAERQGADMRVRYFTPGGEIDLCGHATIGAFFALAYEGRVKLDRGSKIINIETKAGVLPVELITSEEGKLDRVVMGQNTPRIIGTIEDRETVAELMGLDSSALELQGLPMQIVSTGVPDLMVPVKNLAALKKARPDFPRLAQYQREKGFISIHAFTFETETPAAMVHTRDFAPSVDIDEEAATGTANCSLGSYLVINKAISLNNEKIIMKVEQGYIMERPSEIIVELVHKHGEVTEVKVGGKSVIAFEGMMTI